MSVIAGCPQGGSWLYYLTSLSSLPEQGRECILEKITGLGFKHCTQAWFYVDRQPWLLLLAQISLKLAHFNLLPEKHPTPWHREAWGRFPKVRTSRLDHGRTGHSENEIGFFQEFLMQNDFLRALYLGFDWSGWIALIKSKILIMVETCHQYGISALVPWPRKIFCFSVIFPWPWQPCHCITDRQTITVCSSW